MNSNRKKSDMEVAADNLEYFVNYVSSPWRIMWTNFLAGIFRGLGALIGASIVIAVAIWLLSVFNKIPVLGEYTKELDKVVESYIDKANYNDELDQIGGTLERIEEQLKKPNS